MANQERPVWEPVLDSLINCDFNKVIPEEERDGFNLFVRAAVDSHSGFLVQYEIEGQLHAFYYSSDRNKVVSVRETIVDIRGNPHRMGRNYILDPNRTIEEILILPRWEIPSSLTTRPSDGQA